MKKSYISGNANGEDQVETLFKRYLAVCNQALEKHNDKFPYKEIISAAEVMVGENPIDLAVYDDEPKASFSVKFKDRRLVHNGPPIDPKKAWRMNLSYIEKVVENSDDYINNPEKLDLDWLKSRLGF